MAAAISIFRAVELTAVSSEPPRLRMPCSAHKLSATSITSKATKLPISLKHMVTRRPSIRLVLCRSISATADENLSARSEIVVPTAPSRWRLGCAFRAATVRERWPAIRPLGQRKVGVSADIEGGELAGREFGKSGGGDHRGVVGGEADGREVDRIGQLRGAGGGAQSRIAGDSAGNNEAARPDGFRRGGGAGEQFVDHGMLKRSQ